MQRPAAPREHVRFLRNHADHLGRTAFEGFLREGPGALLPLDRDETDEVARLTGSDVVYVDGRAAMEWIRSWVEDPGARRDAYEELLNQLRSYDPYTDVLVLFLEDGSGHETQIYRVTPHPVPALGYLAFVN